MQHHFGDVFGRASAVEAGLCGSPARWSFRDRLVLTANGTLQALVGAWFNRAVDLRVRSHVPESENVFRRVVELRIPGLLEGDRAFAVAESRVTVRDAALGEFCRTNGIGQTFAKFRIPPVFELLDAQRLDEETDGGEGGAGRGRAGFWRRYRLSAPDRSFECDIRETFPEGNPLDVGNVEGKPDVAGLRRVFCMASGNVQRIASAVTGRRILIRLVYEHPQTQQTKIQALPRTSCFARKVELLDEREGAVFCAATSEICVKEDALDEDTRVGIRDGSIPLASLLTRFAVAPEFTLHGVWPSSPVAPATSFSREYSLDTPQVSLRIHEDFDLARMVELNI